MLFYKAKGSENLGLCYGTKGERCNCDKATAPQGTCDDSLWIKYPVPTILMYVVVQRG